MMSNSTNFSVISDWNIDWREHSYLIAYIGTPILVLGILMNLSGIIILLLKQKTHKSIFHKLIIYLAIWDISYLTVSLLSMIIFFQNTNLTYTLNMYFFPLRFTFLTGSIYSTIAITLDRYFIYIILPKELLGGSLFNSDWFTSSSNGSQKFTNSKFFSRCLKNCLNKDPLFCFFVTHFKFKLYFLIFSFQRYIAFCHPLSYHTKKIKSRQYILVILVFSICYNIPQWFAFEADFEKFILIDKRNSTFFLVRFLICTLVPTW